MANLFSVFNSNPSKMPGQGLASPDFNPEQQSQQYDWLLQEYRNGLNNYGQDIGASQNAMLETRLNGRGGAPGVVATYLKSIRQADPQAASLLDSLTQTANQELALDNRLDANQINQLEQSSRAGSAARGLGYGPSDVYEEMLAKMGYGEQLRQQRRGNALGLAQYRTGLAQRPTDMATQISLSQSPEQNMWNALLTTYSQNQANAREKAQLETQIGMHQAGIWNDWFKTAAGAMVGGGGGAAMMGGK